MLVTLYVNFGVKLLLNDHKQFKGNVNFKNSSQEQNREIIAYTCTK